MEKLDYKKRYYVVYISENYPAGFLDDVYYTSDNIEDCKVFGHENFMYDYFIFDRIEVETIYEAWKK